MVTISKRVTGKGDVRYRVQVRLRGYPERRATFEARLAGELDEWRHAEAADGASSRPS